MQDAEDVKMLCDAAREMPVSVVHLIHRSRRWQSNSTDYEFSRRSMLEHWAAGRPAVRKTMPKRGVPAHQIGRAACRQRWCMDVEHPVSAGATKKNKKQTT